MIDRKEKQGSIIPLNKNVMVKFVEYADEKTDSGIILPDSGLKDDIKFGDGDIYKVEIMRKADDCFDYIPDSGFALVPRLDGYGIPTIEGGYVKLINESMLLMTSKTEKFTIDSIKPQAGRLLCEVTSLTDVTEGGIIVPEGTNDASKFDAATLGGVVVEVSPDIKGYKKGDVIRWDSYFGAPVHIDGKEYRLVLANEILAKIETM